MSLKRVECSVLVCDGCGKECGVEDGVEYTPHFMVNPPKDQGTVEDVRREFDEWGWQDIDGKDFCSNCWEWDEEADEPKVKAA